MPTKDLINYFETGAIVGTAVYGLNNIYTILGIILLCLDLGLIIVKIVQAIKNAKGKTDNTGEIETALNEAKGILEKIQDKLPKETTNGGEDTKSP